MCEFFRWLRCDVLLKSNGGGYVGGGGVGDGVGGSGVEDRVLDSQWTSSSSRQRDAERAGCPNTPPPPSGSDSLHRLCVEFEAFGCFIGASNRAAGAYPFLSEIDNA